MGIIKTAFLTLVLAAIVGIIFLFMDVMLAAAPQEIGGSADAIGGAATVLSPTMPFEYAALFFIAALVIAGVHALFKHRAAQGQV